MLLPSCSLLRGVPKLTPLPKSPCFGEWTLGPAQHALPFPDSAPNSFWRLCLCPLCSPDGTPELEGSPQQKRGWWWTASCRAPTPRLCPCSPAGEQCAPENSVPRAPGAGAWGHSRSWLALGRSCEGGGGGGGGSWGAGLPRQWVGPVLELLNSTLSLLFLSLIPN